MTCAACGQEERQDRKTALADVRSLTLHRECPDGHAWHLPLITKRGRGRRIVIARWWADAPRDGPTNGGLR